MLALRQALSIWKFVFCFVFFFVGFFGFCFIFVFLNYFFGDFSPLFSLSFPSGSYSAVGPPVWLLSLFSLLPL